MPLNYPDQLDPAQAAGRCAPGRCTASTAAGHLLGPPARPAGAWSSEDSIIHSAPADHLGNRRTASLPRPTEDAPHRSPTDSAQVRNSCWARQISWSCRSAGPATTTDLSARFTTLTTRTRIPGGSSGGSAAAVVRDQRRWPSARTRSDRFACPPRLRRGGSAHRAAGHRRGHAGLDPRAGRALRHLRPAPERRPLSFRWGDADHAALGCTWAYSAPCR